MAFAGKKILALITARGGSKGVPGKNIRSVGGKPLIAWTIDAVKSSKYVDHSILSSDDAEIIDAAKRFGCDVPFIRPAELARDDSPSIDAILHALEAVPGYEYLVVLQPTSPLRTGIDIDGTIEACFTHDAPYAVTVTPTTEPPHWTFYFGPDASLSRVVPENAASRRQDLPSTVILNGAVYVARIEALKHDRTFLTAKTVGFEMPNERSLDIDTPTDFAWLEFILATKAQ